MADFPEDLNYGVTLGEAASPKEQVGGSYNPPVPAKNPY